MKFNVHVFKSKPLLYGGAFLVFFFVVLHFLNKNAGASSNGGVLVQNSGPSDAQLAASTQLGLAGISANVALAQTQAQLQAISLQGDNQNTLANIAATVDLTKAHLDADMNLALADKSLSALQIQTGAQVEMNADNNAFQIGYSKLAYDSALSMTAMNTALQLQLSRDQLAAYQTGQFLSAAQGLKGDTKKLTAIRIAAGVSGAPPSVYANDGGNYASIGMPSVKIDNGPSKSILGSIAPVFGAAGYLATI